MAGEEKDLRLPPIRRSGDPNYASDINALRAAISKVYREVKGLKPQSSPDIGVRVSAAGGFNFYLRTKPVTKRRNCRFQITVDDKIRVGPGVLMFQTRGGASIITPSFPTLNGISIGTEGERPGFPVEGLTADAKYRVILRHTTAACNRTRITAPGEGDGAEGKIELLEPGEDPELEDDERAVVIGEVTLKDHGDKLVAKKIKQRLGSDYKHSCAGTDPEAEDSDDTSVDLSDQDPDDSGSGFPPDDSDDPGSGSDEDDEDPSCDGVKIKAKWMNMPSCVEKPAFGGPRPFMMTTSVSVELLGKDTAPEIGGGLYERCPGWWAQVTLSNFTPIENQCPANSVIEGSTVRFPIGPGGSFSVGWKIANFVPCAEYGFVVSARSNPDPDSDKDPCCGKTTQRGGSFKMPGWCREGCTTFVTPPGP